MKHDEQKMHELLCAYVLGEVNEDERAQVEIALAKDAELREERARLEATIGLVQGVMGEPEKLSPSATSELLEKAKMSVQTPIWSRPSFRMAAALLVMLGGALVFLPREKPASESGEIADETSSHRLIAKNVVEKEVASRGMLDRGRVSPQMARDGKARRQSEGEEEARYVNLDDSFLEDIFVNDLEAKDKVDSLGGSDHSEVFTNYEAIKKLVEGQNVALGKLETEKKTSGEHGRFGDPTAFNGTEETLSVIDLNGFGGSAGNPEFDPLTPRKESTRTSDLGNSELDSTGTYRGPGDSTPPGAVFPEVRGQFERDSGGRLIARDIERDSRRVDLFTWSSSPEPPSVSFEQPSPRGESGKDIDWGAGRKIRDFLDSPQSGNARASIPRKVKKESPGARAERLITDARRIWNEPPSHMFFRYWGDKSFEFTREDPLSTFSIDVDTASYAMAREYLRGGVLPPKAAVRTEEFLNYFKADVPAPRESDFGIHTELAPSAFADGSTESWMMRVVVRGREVTKAERLPLSLTFVVDTSGSMKSENRMELVKHALRLLVAELDANDSIAIVSFNSEARLVLPMVSIANRSSIETAIHALQANGSTNAEAGLKLGYAQAVDALREDAGNRVIFLSDGVANVGVTDQERISEDVRAQRERGIYLNTIGVGMGNNNDTFLEQLANKGDGICNYVNDEREAHRAIVENFTGAFETIANDVKIQVEFDPKQVESYRLLGYENRAIVDRDFRNDAVDAGEVGAGHQVTALYEIVRVGGSGREEAPLATVRLRWKKPKAPSLQMGREAEAPEVTEIEHPVRASDAASAFLSASAGYRQSVIVAQFAEFLRRSRHVRTDSVDALIVKAKRLEAELRDDEFSEFVALVEGSAELIRKSLGSQDELSMTLDALRENHILCAKYNALTELGSTDRDVKDAGLLEQFERQNRELEARIRELVAVPDTARDD